MATTDSKSVLVRMPPELKRGLAREVARRASTMNDVAVGLLAARLGVAFAPSGRKGSVPGETGVALIGVGNCANSLLQGVEYYKDADPETFVPGLMHVDLGGYHVRDIEFTAAFDVTKDKVGKDLADAMWAHPNDTYKFADVPKTGITVSRGMTHDGIGKYLSEVVETITHRVLTSLFRERGVHLDKTMQLNVGGNSDFLNMLERERLESKKISKTNAVTSMLDYDLGAENVHVGPSDYVPWLTDRKWAYIRMEGTSFGGAPLNVELKLEVWDSPNSAGIVIDAVRLAKLALNQGVSGALEGPSSYLMKSPPERVQVIALLDRGEDRRRVVLRVVDDEVPAQERRDDEGRDARPRAPLVVRAVRVSLAGRRNVIPLPAELVVRDDDQRVLGARAVPDQVEQLDQVRASLRFARVAGMLVLLAQRLHE